MPSVGLEPEILAREPPQNDALNRTATVIRCIEIFSSYFLWRIEPGIKIADISVPRDSSSSIFYIQ
jgi:hypothetical protein